MGRLTNEKCWACSLLTVSEARKLHQAEQGSNGCWSDDTCRSRRSYYRKGRVQGVWRQPQIEELVVPIPQLPYGVLHSYVDKPRQLNDDAVIHALCAELWMGNKPTAMTQPQHTFGLPPDWSKNTHVNCWRRFISAMATIAAAGLSVLPERNSTPFPNVPFDLALTMLSICIIVRWERVGEGRAAGTRVVGSVTNGTAESRVRGYGVDAGCCRSNGGSFA